MPLIALALASCGSNGSSGASGTSAPSTPNEQSSAPATGQVRHCGRREHPILGRSSSTPRALTLYLFQGRLGYDECMQRWVCHGVATAAGEWPAHGRKRNQWLPARDQPQRSDGTLAGDLQRPPPVYTFAKDSKAGDTNGEGVNAFGGPWYVLSPAGDQVTSAPSSSSTSGY